MTKSAITTAEVRRQVEATFELLKAIAEIIRHTGEIPSGELYARMMGKVTLNDYNSLIATLKRTGLVTATPGHLLRWTGPKDLGTTPENNNHN